MYTHLVSESNLNELVATSFIPCLYEFILQPSGNYYLPDVTADIIPLTNGKLQNLILSRNISPSNQITFPSNLFRTRTIVLPGCIRNYLVLGESTHNIHVTK